MKKLLFMVCMFVAGSAVAGAEHEVEKNPVDVSIWTHAARCQSVTRMTQFVVSRLYSVPQDTVGVTIRKAFKGPGQDIIAVGVEAKVGRATCELAWKANLESCAGDLETLACNQP